MAPWLRRTRLGHGRGLRVLLWAAVLVPLAQWPLAQSAGGLYDSVVDGCGLYRWHLFAAGVAAYLVSTGRLRRGHGLAVLACCVAAHAVQNGWWSPTAGLVTDPWSVAGVGLGVVALLLAARMPALRIEPPRAVALVARRLAGISFGVLQTVAMLVQALVLGAAMTRCVERPAHRALMRAFDTRRRAPRPTPAGPRPEPAPAPRELVGASAAS